MVAAVAVPVRAGPLEGPGRDRLVAPGRVRLEAVVEAAQAGEVVGLGRSGLGSALGFGVDIRVIRKTGGRVAVVGLLALPRRAEVYLSPELVRLASL